MRINKSNPRHIYFLVLSGLLCSASVIVRPFINISKKHKTIILYGHTLTGNLKAFFEYLNTQNKGEYKVYFLTLDNKYCNSLSKEYKDNGSILSALRMKDMLIVSRADAIITSHGLHFFAIFKYLTNMKFVDVWHGVPFKGYTKSNFKQFRSYSQTWVTSYNLKKFYQSWGWDQSKIKITGYARVDKFVSRTESKERLRAKYKIDDKFNKIILFALTWKQSNSSNILSPFGSLSNQEYLSELNSLGKNTRSLIIFRTHINDDDIELSGKSNIRFMSANEYSDTEEILYITDLLISDWSSIVFDFLVLRRPTIFLDTSFPYKDGYTVNPKYRFGEVVKSHSQLIKTIKLYISNPDIYSKKYSRAMDEVSSYVWGKTLDGQSSNRYYKNLIKLLEHQ